MLARMMFLPETPDRLARRAVAFHWPVLLHMVRVLTDALGLAHGTPETRIGHASYLWFHKELRLAETIMRRVLVLIAASFPAPVLRSANTASGQGRAARKPRSQPDRAPLFSLLDPMPRRKQETPAGPRATGNPRIWWPGKPDGPPKPPARTAIMPGAQRAAVPLLTRARALQDVIENTGPHVARMARLIARQRAATADIHNLPKRDRPLRHGRAPGVSKKRLRASWWDFASLNRCAAEFLDVGWPDTS